MTEHKIITIGRQFGSGGHEIGNCLATRLNIPLYDNNLVRMVAEKLDIREETAQAVDETTLNSFLEGYVLAPIQRTGSAADDYTQPLTEQVYALQSEIIRKLADRGPCVIVGRCGDYVLREYPGLINVFICADRIKRIDRERRYYYESHTGMEWGSIEAHQVLLNVSRLGLEGTVDLLEMMYRA